MPQYQPSHCRRSAFELFAEQLAHLRSPDALLYAAVAISKHELAEAHPLVVDQQLNEWADRIRSQLKRLDPRAMLAHGHDLLFDRLHFEGNESDYNNPFNSYLPIVMETRRGIPITMVLIYRELMRRLGLAVHGVNAPGHFLAAVEDPVSDELMYIDVFHGGRLLSRDEAFDIIEQVVGPVPRTEQMMPLASPEQWLSRMLRNLEQLFARQHRAADVAAMNEMATLLDQAA